MKKTILFIFAGIIGVKFAALADVQQASKLTPLQKGQIAWAIKILGDTKALVTDENQCVQLDQDILSVLESEDRIEQGDAQTMVICIGPTK